MLLIKIACDFCWKPDKELVQAMAEFQEKQLREDSLRAERAAAYRRRDSLRAVAQRARYRKDSLRAAARRTAASKDAAPAASRTATSSTAASCHTARTISQAALNLNTADSVQLMAVPGIGAYTARKILQYRHSLGGFVSVDQLSEIEGLHSENLTALKACAFIEKKPAIRRMAVNKAGVKSLLRHPYISYEQAVALVRLREEGGRLKNLESLSFLDEFSPKDLHRLGPYLDFEL